MNIHEWVEQATYEELLEAEMFFVANSGAEYVRELGGKLQANINRDLRKAGLKPK